MIPTHQFFAGSIEVICGPMFSGKTEELIRRIRRAQIARQKVQIFKPKIDNRYHDNNIVSHDSLEVEAMAVESAIDILKKLYDTTRIVAIDEVQFFDPLIVKVIKKLARRGMRVICAGLDQDFRGLPFGPMPEILCIADKVDKVHAICTVCGGMATKTYRKSIKAKKKQSPHNAEEQIVIGESDLYEARCRIHFDFQGEDEEEDLLAYTLPGLEIDADQEELLSKFSNQVELKI